MKRLTIICILLTIAVVVSLYALSGKRVSKPTLPWTKAIGGEDDATQWFKTGRTKIPRGVALVVHGLNLKPERMQAIIAGLNEGGIDVLNLSLKGHGNNYSRNMNAAIDGARLESFRTVTYSLWLNEIYDAYLRVRERASKNDVPVFFIGYSLGGLLGCDLILSHPDVSYDRIVLFAPALNITVESYLLKALVPFPNIVIDSLSPISYRANEGTPMAAYKALFEAIEHFEKNASGRLNKPTLIFIDEKDEFVSCSKLKEMMARRNLDCWQIRMVQKDNDVGEKISHHLIIDGDTVGKRMWREIKDAVKRHLSTGV